MGGSYIVLFTGFYVDNGNLLPGLKELPHAWYWVIPTLIGTPIVWWGLHRFTSRHSPDT